MYRVQREEDHNNDGKYRWNIEFKNHYKKKISFSFRQFANRVEAQNGRTTARTTINSGGTDLSYNFVSNSENISLKTEKFRFGDDWGDYDDCENGGAVKVDYSSSSSNSNSNTSSSRSSSQNRQNYMELGNQAVRNEQWDEALNYYQQAQKIQYNEGTAIAIRGVENKIQQSSIGSTSPSNTTYTNNNYSSAGDGAGLLVLGLVELFSSKRTKAQRAADREKKAASKYNKEKEGKYNKGKKYFDDNKFDKALPYFKDAALLGHTAAQYYAGDLLIRVENNIDKGIFWLGQAAIKEHIPSIHRLADIYYTGEKVPVDFLSAYQLFTIAAQEGHAPSMIKLGDMYSIGQYAEENKAEAYYYYKKACENGDNLGCNKKLKEGLNFTIDERRKIEDDH